MPVRFEFDLSRKLVITTVTGVVSAKDMSAYQAELAGDARFSPTFDVLMEFDKGSVFAGNGEEIRRLAHTSPFSGGGRRVYVVSSDVQFGLSRIAQEYSDLMGVRAELFRDRGAALAWLDREKSSENRESA